MWTGRRGRGSVRPPHRGQSEGDEEAAAGGDALAFPCCAAGTSSGAGGAPPSEARGGVPRLAAAAGAGAGSLRSSGVQAAAEGSLRGAALWRPRTL